MTASWTSQSRIVRLYAAALINFHKINPVDGEDGKDKSDKVESVSAYQFGDADKLKADKKKRRYSKRRKKKKWFEADPKLLASCYAGGRQVSEAELAKRAKRAKLAMGQAGELAGEPVIYCCGMIRAISSIDYECGCSESLRHRIINQGE